MEETALKQDVERSPRVGRVLAHVHTFNDADFINQALDSIYRQTRPVDGIVIVDNGSNDDTLDRDFPDGVVVIRNGENLGTSGAVVKGMAHALENGFDWAWLFDADSVPEPDALENLLAFYEGLAPHEQESVCSLSCNLRPANGTPRDCPMTFTKHGIAYESLDGEGGHVRYDCFIWTGSLYRMEAVRKIGLPNADYVLDLGELEYGYRAHRLGFKSYMVKGAVLHQDVGRKPGVHASRWGIGRFSVRLFNISAIRSYYHVRNMIYFWLYQCRPVRPLRIARALVHGILFPRTFLVRPFTHRRQLVACARGFWDGLTNHMERRY